MYGLTDERYQQLIDYGVANYTIEGLIRYYGLNVVQKGYMQCRQEYYSESSPVIPNALHIEHVSQLATFDSDWEACRQAEKDGVQFINDMDGLEKGFYIDTPENRDICADGLEKYPDLRVENWLDIEDGEWGSRYAERFLKKDLQHPEEMNIRPDHPTRRLNVTIMCQAVYNSGIDVPADLSFEKAVEYAKEHIADIPLGAMEYVPDSDVLDEANCDFEEERSEAEVRNKNHEIEKPVEAQESREAATQRLMDAVLNYLAEHNDSSELYRMLHGDLEMTHEEIEFLGFDLPQCYEPQSGVNTKISYLYRDADNYKVFNECVVEGVVTEEQREIILGCLDEETYFIPSQVGLPEKRFDEITEADHCWFEFDDFKETQEAPTVQIKADDLVQAFCDRKGRWEEKQLSADEKRDDTLSAIVHMNKDDRDRLQSEIAALYEKQLELTLALEKEYQDGKTDWAAQLEVKIEDIEKQIAEKEELLKKSRMLTVGTYILYHDHICEVIHVDGDKVYLQDNSSDLHFEVSIDAYLDSNPSIEKPPLIMNMDTHGLEIAGYVGTWHTIDHTVVAGQTFWLMEHDVYGTDAAHLIVDGHGEAVLTNIHDGFDEHTMDLLRQESLPVDRMPDDSISVEEMKKYGYVWGGMLPMREAAATEVMKSCTIYRLYGDDSEGMVIDVSEIKNHAAAQGIFGVEKVEWLAMLERQRQIKDAQGVAEAEFVIGDEFIEEERDVLASGIKAGLSKENLEFIVQKARDWMEMDAICNGFKLGIPLDQMEHIFDSVDPFKKLASHCNERLSEFRELNMEQAAVIAEKYEATHKVLLSSMAKDLYSGFKEKYRTSDGWKYSGGWKKSDILATGFRETSIDELLQKSIIYPRNTSVESYELSVFDRAAMIWKEDLESVWKERDGNFFLINDGYDGEIHQVLLETLEKGRKMGLAPSASNDIKQMAPAEVGRAAGTEGDEKDLQEREEAKPTLTHQIHAAAARVGTSSTDSRHEKGAEHGL